MKFPNNQQILRLFVQIVAGCLFAILYIGLFLPSQFWSVSWYYRIFYFIYLMFVGAGIFYGLLCILRARAGNNPSRRMVFGLFIYCLAGISLALAVPIRSPTLMQKHSIQIVATGKMNQQSLGSEVWLYSITTKKQVYSSNLQEICHGNWESRNDALISYQNQPSNLVCELVAADYVKIKFGTNEWSGKVKLTLDQQVTEEMDLFSIDEEKENETVTLEIARSKTQNAVSALLTLASGFWIGLLTYTASTFFLTNQAIDRYPIQYGRIQNRFPSLDKVYKQILTWIFGLLPVAAYLLVFVLPVPFIFIESSKVLLYLSISVVILSWTLRKPGKKLFFISLAVILVFIGFSILSLWAYTRVDFDAMEGLLPYSDSLGYYRDAFSISGGEKVSYSTWANRILHTTFLADLLALTNMNLQATLALMGFLWGIVVLFLSKELEYSIGYGSGAICAFLCLAFYHACVSGTLMSENTGFLLGGTGTAMLLSSARRNEFLRVLLGIFLLTLALNARNGAFLVLPFLVIWASLYFSKGFSIRNFVLAISASLASFGLNAYYLSFFSDATRKMDYFAVRLPELIWSTITQNNLHDVFHMYPGLTRAEVSKKLIQVIIQMVQSDPWNVIRNFFYQYYANILKPYAHLLIGFMGKANEVGLFVKILYVLLYAGLLISLLRYKQKTYGLFIFSFLGVFISVPLVYYVGYRAIASTMPLTFCIIAAGAAFLIERLIKKPVGPVDNDVSFYLQSSNHFDYILQMIAVGLIGWMMVMPMIVNKIKPNLIIPGGDCKSEDSFTFYPLRGNYIKLTDKEANSSLRVPDVEITGFIESNRLNRGEDDSSNQAPDIFDTGSIIFANYYPGRQFILVPGSFAVDVKAPISLCLSKVKELNKLLLATSVSYVGQIDWTRKWAFWGITGIILLSYIVAGFLIMRMKGSDHSQGKSFGDK